MRAHAIVIGIDAYTKPEWCLTGAVRDAIAFARWAVSAGGVELDDLTLLLSPLATDPPLVDRLQALNGVADLSARVASPTRAAIAQTFYAYQTGKAKTADRLWVYYGGHGLAPAGHGTAAGPLIVPADVDNLDYYVNIEPVGLDTFREAMEDVPPKQQFYFVDACRDVLPPIGNKVLTQQLLWDVRNVDDEQLATQAIFLATTAGKRAKELRGHGLFGRALLAALRGLGPQLRPPAAPTAPGEVPRRRLLYDDLVAFVKNAVDRAIKDLPGVHPADLNGLPYARVNRLSGELTVAEFAPKEVPTAKLTTILDPDAARGSARIEFLQWSDDEDRWVSRTSNPAPLGPPVPESATFELRGGVHHLTVTAAGFDIANREVLVYEDKRIPIELQAQAVTRDVFPGTPSRGRGDETLAGDALESLESVAPTTGSITAHCRDSLARISVLDGGGKERARAYGHLTVEGLAPGPYRVAAELTSRDRADETVQVRAGERTIVVLRIAGPPMSEALAEQLVTQNIRVDDNYSYPSENFGGAVANARLGSMLAYAAWAARWPPSRGFTKLRAIGINPLPGLERHDSALQVLVGDLAPNSDTTLDDLRLQITTATTAVMPLMIVPVPGLVGARQASTVLPPGPIGVGVAMRDFSPASFAVSLIPGFVTVLVISREDNGDIDVQQYLNPIDPMVAVAEGFAPPLIDDVRLVELAWRALEGRDPLDAIEYGGLIAGKRSNPLLGVIAGYRMLPTSRADEFRVIPEPPPTPGITRSPLWNLVRFFPGLPDVHILAGLYDPERRDEHFARAREAGTPVLTEGLWTLVDWVTSQAMQAGVTPPTLRLNVLPGTVWTGFSELVEPAGVESIRVLPNAGRPHIVKGAGNRYVSFAHSVGRLELEGEAGALGSCFLVAPMRVVCAIDPLSDLVDEIDGRWILRTPMRVRFDRHNASADRVIRRVIGRLGLSADISPGGSGATSAMENENRVLVLELSEPAAAQPLARATRVPEVNQRIAVIGFPQDQWSISSTSTFAQHFVGAAGEKHVMPGAVVRSSKDAPTFEYECFTPAGTNGGPVIDLETGTVTGIHLTALAPLDGRKRGVAVALSLVAPEVSDI
jgi:hypothetical protein